MNATLREEQEEQGQSRSHHERSTAVLKLVRNAHILNFL